jgi:hypothetical protein
MAEILDKYHESLKRTKDLTDKLESATSKLASATSDLHGVLGKLKGHVSTYGNLIGDLYQSQLKIERGMRTTGVSATALYGTLDSLNKTTNLSIQQSTKLFETFEKGYVGIRKMSVMKELIKDINDLGITAEETERIMGSLSEAQKKYTTIAERMNNGGKLTMFERMTLDPQVIRDMDTLFLKKKNLLKNDSKANFLGDVAAMEKQWADTWIQIQKSAVPVLTEIAKGVKSLLVSLDPAIKMLEKLTGNSSMVKLIAGVAAFKTIHPILRKFKDSKDDEKIGSKEKSKTGSGGPGSVGAT